MALIDLDDKIVEIVNKDNHTDFIYDFLRIYDIPNATITKLKNGNTNLSKNADEVHLKNKLFFKETNGDVFDAFVSAENTLKEYTTLPRYIIVTDYKTILAKDTKNTETLDILFTDLPLHFDFFLAWNGIERVDFQKENPADIKAAERFARLYDVLAKDNGSSVSHASLDMFLTRLLFCLFAEDTGIFPYLSFTDAVKRLTSPDGSDLNTFFRKVFAIMDQPENIRDKNLPDYMAKFPYVNGQLFTETHEELIFSKKSRRLIVDAGELLDWSKINPDIFGSMIQAVATEDSRSHLGMHYTSVPNIMKVIKPLFLDDLNKAFDEAYQSVHKLEKLKNRIGKIKFLDPACGSGNFLIITYKELRRLEIRILQRQMELGENIMYVPSVNLGQFYGIEVDDFAHDVAKLSLWIADHQMNKELEELFGDSVRPTLPLTEAGDIRCANALRVDWNSVCSNNDDEEIFVFGNPPYFGAKLQLKDHKADMEYVFKGVKKYKSLDYICGWFYLAAKYIKGTKAKCAFVTTNSICQGEQTSILWPEIFENNVEIFFAHTSFKWNNNAKNNAGVTIAIIGITASPVNEKKLFNGDNYVIVDHINAYLTGGPNVIVENHNDNLNGMNQMYFGSMPRDNGGLVITADEYPEVIAQYPELESVIKKYVGSYEFINGVSRYCLWMDDEDYQFFSDHPFIKERMNIVFEFRSQSKADSTKAYAERPHLFVQRGTQIEARKKMSQNSLTILVPNVSSENRAYVPMGVVGIDTIISNLAMAIFDAPLYILGLLESRMHMAWLRSIGGKLKTDYRYSIGLVYNTFPVPELSTRRKNEIEEAILNILDIREEEGGTLSELYGSPLADNNPKPMNDRLRQAHVKLDGIVERAYRSKPFENDEERLEMLLSMYQEMTK
ncbi:DNA methyltransferase [Bacillus cereus]|nr:DNA methyltransferase [Bacillus cereus]